MSSNLDPATYIEGLKREMENAVRAGRDEVVKEVKAELDRVAGKKPAETAEKPDDTEKA